MQFMLGKKAARTDPRTLKLARYLRPAPAAPAAVNWLKPGAWPMYGNDRLGDCVEAASGHMEELWTSWTAPAQPWPDQAQIIEAYTGATGYVPGDPATDQGTDMLQFLNYWRQTGVAGSKILAYCALRPGNLAELRLAVYLFGAAMIGLQLPVSAQGKTAWTVPGRLTGAGLPGSWGGHCVPVGGYDTTRPARLCNTVVTWGAELTMSDYFYQCYCDEAYAVLSSEWLAAGKSPAGFDMAQLRADLAAL